MKTQSAVGKLYVVATPIGNPLDITIRGINTLKNVQGVICEEIRLGSTLLKTLGIPEKLLTTLNEHNETDQAALIVKRIISGENLALISDCGTPVFADPGAKLIRAAEMAGAQVIPIPGVSSIMTVLSVISEPMEQFFFGGFLPRDAENRQKNLLHFSHMKVPVILMDTPYRMSRTLSEISSVINASRKITLACNLTSANEWIMTAECVRVIQELPFKKAEFIVVIHPDL